MARIGDASWAGIDTLERDGGGAAGPPRAAADGRRTTVALLLYPDLTELDLVRPLRLFAGLQALDPGVEIVVVGPTVQPGQANGGATLRAGRTLDGVTRPHVIVVPGGRTAATRALSDPAVRSWIRATAPTTGLVTSVSVGCLILATSGALARGATSTPGIFCDIVDDEARVRTGELLRRRSPLAARIVRGLIDGVNPILTRRASRLAASGRTRDSSLDATAAAP